MNRCWAFIALLWIAWCLYWPFYARRQDRQSIAAQTGDAYRLCLQQSGLAPATCAADRQAYTSLHERITWPPGQNVYQSFAGKTPQEALSFFTVLCLFPVISGYLLLRAVLELFLWFARARPQDIPAPTNQ